MVRNAVVAIAVAILLASSPAVDAAAKKVIPTRENWPELTLGKKVVIFFHWPWCHHCKVFKPIWNRVKRKLASDDLVFLELNCDDKEQDKMCNDLGVSAVPKLMWGNTAKQFKYTGEMLEEDIEEFINETVMKKPVCSILEPDNCDVDDRDDITAIDKLTTEYLEKLTALGHPDPVKMAQQTAKKAGFANPFWEDASGIQRMYGDQPEEQLFTSSRTSIREQVDALKEREARMEEDDDDDMPFMSEL
jgi:thiol-disulfide isomerase/thioredoxin